MSVEVLNSLKQQIIGLSEAEKHSLAEWLQKNSHQTSDNLRQRRRDWVSANRGKYGGLYVALDGDRLIGAGKNFPEALEAAKKAGKPDAFVDFVPPEDYVGEIGGWE
jgi:hypothetical protein